MADIIVSKLNKSFGDKAVLRDFSAVFKAGETTCIMGRSGCGKTTLLNILMGFLRQDSGSIKGLPTNMAAVFQENRLLEEFSCTANLLFAAPKADDETILSCLASVGLAEVRNQPVSKLSGGMKRRVAIARALIVDVPLLILDEPFKGLDSDTRSIVAESIKAQTKGKTLIMVTHDEDELSLMNARLITMS